MFFSQIPYAQSNLRHYVLYFEMKIQKMMFSHWEINYRKKWEHNTTQISELKKRENLALHRKKIEYFWGVPVNREAINRSSTVLIIVDQLDTQWFSLEHVHNFIVDLFFSGFTRILHDSFGMYYVIMILYSALG